MNFRGIFSFEELIIRIVILALSLYIVSKWTKLVHVPGFWDALIGAILFGIINQFVRPVMQIIALPLTVLTLGIGYFLVNGLMLTIVSWLHPKIRTEGCLASTIAVILISVVNWLLYLIIPNAGKPF